MRWIVLALVLAGCSAPSTPQGLEGEELRGYAATPLNGGNASLADYQGDVVLLTVWASWCSVCKGDEPVWDQLQTDYAPQGFQVYAVSREADKARAQDYVDGFEYGYAAYWDSNVNAAFGMHDYQPNHVLIDRDGSVVHQFEGSFKRQAGGEAGLRTMIEELLA